MDRKVTISLIISLLVNAGATIWWASSISFAVQELRSTDEKHELVLNSLTTGRESNANRITSLEAKGLSIETKLGRIEDKLDRIIEHSTR